MVLGTRNSFIRSRFLTEENLTLEKSIAIGRSYEQAQKQPKAIDNQVPEKALRMQKKTREMRYQTPRWNRTKNNNASFVGESTKTIRENAQHMRQSVTFVARKIILQECAETSRSQRQSTDA